MVCPCAFYGRAPLSFTVLVCVVRHSIRPNPNPNPKPSPDTVHAVLASFLICLLCCLCWVQYGTMPRYLEVTNHHQLLPIFYHLPPTYHLPPIIMNHYQFLSRTSYDQLPFCQVLPVTVLSTTSNLPQLREPFQCNESLEPCTCHCSL
ncbi:unnamed protein product [Discosporangium mesarthrocarpum]